MWLFVVACETLSSADEVVKIEFANRSNVRVVDAIISILISLVADRRVEECWHCWIGIQIGVKLWDFMRVSGTTRRAFRSEKTRGTTKSKSFITTMAVAAAFDPISQKLIART